MRQRIFNISLYFRLFSVGFGIASTTRSVCCLSVPSPGLRRKFWPAYSYAIHGLTVMFYKCENHRMANTRNWKNTKKRFDFNRGCGVKMQKNVLNLCFMRSEKTMWMSEAKQNLHNSWIKTEIPIRLILIYARPAVWRHISRIFSVEEIWSKMVFLLS